MVLPLSPPVIGVVGVITIADIVVFNVAVGADGCVLYAVCCMYIDILVAIAVAVVGVVSVVIICLFACVGVVVVVVRVVDVVVV